MVVLVTCLFTDKHLMNFFCSFKRKQVNISTNYIQTIMFYTRAILVRMAVASLHMF